MTLLIQTGRRHVDVRHLPSLVPKQYLNATAQAVNAELIARIKRLQDVVDSGSLEIDAQASGIFPLFSIVLFHPYTDFLN